MPQTDGARRGASSTAAAPAKLEDEPRVNAFFAGYIESGRERFLDHLRHEPVEGIRTALAAQRLPEIVVDADPSGEGPLVQQNLTGSRIGLVSIRGVLTLPATPEEVSLGSSKQTLRRKSRAAEKLGVTWRSVDDREERLALLARAEQHEREHPRLAYRGDPDDGRQLLDVGLWLAAYAADGRAVLLAVLPVHGPVAALRLFRVLEDTDEATNGRYLMTRVAGEELVRRGVTHLIDVVHPAKLKNGLRHFQRMNGFRLRRVRIG